MMDMNDITIEQQFVPKTEDSYETWSGVDSFLACSVGY
jgi:hypothetical protein